MPPSEPAWWYGPRGSGGVLVRALRPIGRLYGEIAERRFRRGQPYRSRLPVICVGNFTAGGTGKTPLSLAIGAYLIGIGETPVFLTRGYRGREKGPRWVDPENDTAGDCGDEPLLLARTAPTLVSHDRKAGALMIETGERPASVIIMDDGLQNPALKKDLAIAVVDGVRGVGNGEVMPAGPLRAPLEFQLGLVDCVVVNRGSNELGTGARPSGVFGWLKSRFMGPVLAGNVAPAGDAAWLRGAAIAAYAGIGNPARFFATLEALGASLSEKIVFPDHHRFTEGDAGRLLAVSRDTGAVLVTTEKDLARLAGLSGKRAELRSASRALPVRFTFDDRDLGRLQALIDAAMKAGRQRENPVQR